MAARPARRRTIPIRMPTRIPASPGARPNSRNTSRTPKPKSPARKWYLPVSRTKRKSTISGHSLRNTKRTVKPNSWNIEAPDFGILKLPSEGLLVSSDRRVLRELADHGLDFLDHEVGCGVLNHMADIRQHDQFYIMRRFRERPRMNVGGDGLVELARNHQGRHPDVAIARRLLGYRGL